MNMIKQKLQDNIYMLQDLVQQKKLNQKLNDWADMGKLEQKANQFKPKLDRMQEEVIGRKLAEQETLRKNNNNKLKHIQDNVYNTLISR
jgi:hypothetical protein